MKRFASALVLIVAAATADCTSETYDPLGLLGAADDISGRWLGMAPDGATFWDDTADPNCSYEADMELVLEQNGDSLSGTIALTIRDFLGPMTEPSVPCTAVGTETIQDFTGARTATQATFTLEDGVTSFTAFCGKDHLSGELEVDGAPGARGTWRVRK
ncbi:MAG: hypothetical protein JSW46_06115 [Gemmatimonadota bacterium]|nr:MAG: hypothetical protein JSW46_06115 [Gemmatimonadota bacterium]